MAWFPGYEQSYNRFLRNRTNGPLARTYTVFAQMEARRKFDLLTLPNSRSEDIPTQWLNVRSSFASEGAHGETAQDTIAQVGGGGDGVGGSFLPGEPYPSPFPRRPQPRRRKRPPQPPRRRRRRAMPPDPGSYARLSHAR